MTLRCSMRKARATAMPRAEEIEDDGCAAPNGADAVAPARQDLVRVSLVPDIPDQPVTRRVEDVVQRHGKLDDAEAGAEMAAGDRDRIDQLSAQLVGELPQVFLRQLSQIGGNIDLVEQRRPIGDRAGWF